MRRRERDGPEHSYERSSQRWSGSLGLAFTFIRVRLAYSY